MLTFGLNLKTSLRVCAVLGIVIGSLNIIAGGVFMAWGKRERRNSPYSKPLYLYHSASDKELAHQYQVMYRLRVILGGILIAVNIAQITIDAVFFVLTIKAIHKRYIWGLFGLGIVLWIVSLICFTNILSSAGLALLTIVLVGTSIRCYILYVDYLFIATLRKTDPERVDSTKGEKITVFSVTYNEPPLPPYDDAALTKQKSLIRLESL